MSKRTRSTKDHSPGAPSASALSYTSSAANGTVNDISEYERERMDNIKRNEMFLASLGLNSVKASLAAAVPPKAPPKRRSVPTKRDVVDAVPVRRSGRVTIEKVKEELNALERAIPKDEEAIAAKKLELDGMVQKSEAGAYHVEGSGTGEDSRDWGRNETEIIGFQDMVYDPDLYNADLTKLEMDEMLASLRSYGGEENEHKADKRNTPQATGTIGASSSANKVSAKTDKRNIRSTSPPSTTSASTGASHSSKEYLEQLQNLSVDEVTGFQKLTDNRITAVCFHPCTSKTIIFAGDKTGNVGVWDVQKAATYAIQDAQEAAAEDARRREQEPELEQEMQGGSAATSRKKKSSALDTSRSACGVYRYRPHVSAVCKIHASPLAPTQMYTTSYDGTIRFFDMEKEAFALAFTAPEDLRSMFFSDAFFSEDQPQSVFVACNDGCAALVDLRASADSYQWKLAGYSGYKLNSIQQHPVAKHLLVTAERSAISVYDIRAAGSSMKGLGDKMKVNLTRSKYSINAANVSPDGEYLVSVGQDNYIRSFDASVFTGSCTSKMAKDPPCVEIKHDNNTGRWLSTFRPVFDPKCPAAFLVGSMAQPRRSEVFLQRKGEAGEAGNLRVELVKNLRNENVLGSVLARNAFHPTQHMIAGGNSSGRVYLFQ